MTCAALMRSLLQGDRDAFSRLYELTIDRVSGIAQSVLDSPEDQQEVIDDIYLSVWQHPGKYDPARGSVDAWLSVITRNRAVDYYRRRRRMAAVDKVFDQHATESLNAEAPSCDQLLTQHQSAQVLRRALRTLTPLRRRLIGLSFFRGMSHADIATATGIPVGTVKSHVRRALACLKSELGAYA